MNTPRTPAPTTPAHTPPPPPPLHTLLLRRAAWALTTARTRTRPTVPRPAAHPSQPPGEPRP